MSDIIADADIGAELRRRRRARESLIEYARAIEIPGAPATQSDDIQELYKPVETAVTSHHILMLREIQRCVETSAGRLMIFAPPGSAKSTYASVVGPSWAMGKSPGLQILLTSYASDIATKQSRRARSVCRQPLYTSIWEDAPKLLDDQRAADEWTLTNGSGLFAAGIMAGVTGNRVGGAVIDDPVANREAADSPAIRKKTYDEYVDTVLPRLTPTGWLILIQTRWQEEDLAGEILPTDYKGQSGSIVCRDGQTWRVVCLAAECERDDDPLGRKPGEFLWPEWFPREHWSKWRDNPRAARTWSSLYQQRPAPVTGIQFKRADARWYDPDLQPGEEGGPPEVTRNYGASDYATLDDDGDFTEHGLAGMDHRSRLYLLDWWYGQKTTDVSIGHFIRLLGPDQSKRAIYWWNEGGPIDHAIRPAVMRAMRESGRYTVFESMPSIKDKSIKLTSFHARYAAGMVYFPLKRPWAQRLLDYLVAFPAGAHDDGPDVLGLLGRGIDKMANAALPSAPHREPELIPFTGKWIEFNDTQDKPKVRYTS